MTESSDSGNLTNSHPKRAGTATISTRNMRSLRMRKATETPSLRQNGAKACYNSAPKGELNGELVFNNEAVEKGT